MPAATKLPAPLSLMSSADQAGVTNTHNDKDQTAENGGGLGKLVQEQRQGQEQCSGGSGSGGSGGSSAWKERSPLADTILERANTHQMAKLFLQCFHKVHRQGKMNKGRVLSLLKAWRRMSMMVGSDVSLGVGEVMAKTMGLAAWEVENEEEEDLLQEREQGGGGRGEGGQRQGSSNKGKSKGKKGVGVRPNPGLAVFERMEGERQKLQESAFFRRLDDGCTGLCVKVMDQKRHTIAVATNKHYHEIFPEPFRILAAAMQRRCVYDYLVPAFIAHADREMWFLSSIEVHL